MRLHICDYFSVLLGQTVVPYVQEVVIHFIYYLNIQNGSLLLGQTVVQRSSRIYGGWGTCNAGLARLWLIDTISAWYRMLVGYTRDEVG